MKNLTQGTFDARFRSMTVDELIEKLQSISEDGLGGSRVAMTADYGDHCHTTQVLGVRCLDQSAAVRESAYSNSGFALQDEGDIDDNEKEGTIPATVVALS